MKFNIVNYFLMIFINIQPLVIGDSYAHSLKESMKLARHGDKLSSQIWNKKLLFFRMVEELIQFQTDYKVQINLVEFRVLINMREFRVLIKMREIRVLINMREFKVQAKILWITVWNKLNKISFQSHISFEKNH